MIIDDSDVGGALVDETVAAEETSVGVCVWMPAKDDAVELPDVLDRPTETDPTEMRLAPRI